MGVGFIVCIILLIIWSIDHQRDEDKAHKMLHESLYNTNMDRQRELYNLFWTGKDVNGNEITEPHFHPKEIQRLVKIQMEKEGYRYDNFLNWNLEHAVFNEKGEIVSVAGYKIDRTRR